MVEERGQEMKACGQAEQECSEQGCWMLVGLKALLLEKLEDVQWRSEASDEERGQEMKLRGQAEQEHWMFVGLKACLGEKLEGMW